MVGDGAAEARLPSGPNTLTVFGSVSTGLDEFAQWARPSDAVVTGIA